MEMVIGDGLAAGFGGGIPPEHHIRVVTLPAIGRILGRFRGVWRTCLGPFNPGMRDGVGERRRSNLLNVAFGNVGGIGVG